MITMKSKQFLISLFAGVIVFWGCTGNDDGPDAGVNENVRNAFMAKYPLAQNVKWQRKGLYMVAGFSMSSRVAEKNGNNMSAWFDDRGSWYMTETDIPYASLPQTVKDAFETTEYASIPWMVDDVDRLERVGMEDIYVIEVEKCENGTETDVDLYYSGNGVLVKVVADAVDNYDYRDYIPSVPDSSIATWIAQNYPGARIVEYDCEHGFTEVDIVDGRVHRELLFDGNASWVYTKTEVRTGDVPPAVSAALSASEYSGYRIDDVDHYKTVDAEFYRYDLESALGDVKIDISLDGTITIVQAGSVGNNGQMLKSSVSEFISSKYPGSKILEYDYEKGLLEVEIWHESREKNVYFNGQDAWVYTEWDIRVSELPALVTNAIRTSQYSNYRIDDIEYVQTPIQDCYKVELELGNREVELRISANGVIL